MKFGEVYRHRETGITILAIGCLVEEHQVEEAGGRTARPGELVLMTLDQGDYGNGTGGNRSVYWLPGKTGWHVSKDKGVFGEDWDLIGEVGT